MNSEIKASGLVSDVRLFVLLRHLSFLSGFEFASKVPFKGGAWTCPQLSWQRFPSRHCPVGSVTSTRAVSLFPERILKRSHHLNFEAAVFVFGPLPC